MASSTGVLLKGQGYPLIVAVGRRRTRFADYWRDRRSYLAVGSGLTLLVLIAVALVSGTG